MARTLSDGKGRRHLNERCGIATISDYCYCRNLVAIPQLWKKEAEGKLIYVGCLICVFTTLSGDACDVSVRVASCVPTVINTTSISAVARPCKVHVSMDG